MIDPDFTKSMFPDIELKIGRKLSKEENQKIYYSYGIATGQSLLNDRHLMIISLMQNKTIL